MVLDPALTWLDTAGFGPTLRAAMVQEYRSREQQSLDFHSFEATERDPARLRSQLVALAGLLGTTAEDLVFTSGTREGLSLIAQGLDLQPGDEVLTTEHEHPAAIYPWLLEAERRGITVRQLPQTGAWQTPSGIVEHFATALSEKTRVLAFSHVQYTDGTRMPAVELCALARSQNIFTVVDGAQAPGLMDFRVSELGCDAYATCCHKWLNAPYGTGALYLGPTARERLQPMVVDRPNGWDTQDRFGAPLAGGSFGLPATQAKFGALTRFIAPQLAGLSVALEFHRSVSRPRVSTRLLELSAYLKARLASLPGVELLSPAHPSLATGIVSFRTSGKDHAELVATLASEDRIIVGHVRHGASFDAVRASAHIYNQRAEIDKLVNSVRARL